jgi:orotate phosphoribosyltransferase
MMFDKITFPALTSNNAYMLTLDKRSSDSEGTMRVLLGAYEKVFGKYKPSLRRDSNALSADIGSAAIHVVNMSVNTQNITANFLSLKDATRFYRYLEENVVSSNPVLDTDIVSEHTADILWQTGVVRVKMADEGSYRVDDGKNSSPYYIDLRQLTGKGRKPYYNIIVDYSVALLDSESIPFDYIAGTEASGIPLATSMSDRSNVPMIWVRKAAKYKGGPTVEGARKHEVEGKKVVLANDVIAQGRSTSRAIKSLRDLGAVVENCLVIVDRQEGGRALLKDFGIELYNLTDFNKMFLETAMTKRYADPVSIGEVVRHHKNPADWHKSHGLKYYKTDSKTKTDSKNKTASEAYTAPLCLHKR